MDENSIKRNGQTQDKIAYVAFALEEQSEPEEYLENIIAGLEIIRDWLLKDQSKNQQLINISNQIITNMGDQITIGTIHGNFVNKSKLINSLNNLDKTYSENFSLLTKD